MARVEKVLACAAALSALLSGSALAADKAGFYLGAEGGVSFSESTKWQNAEELGAGPATFLQGTHVNTDAGTGWVVGLNAGYRFDDMFRTELAVDYRSGYSVSTSQAGLLDKYNVDIDAWTFMVNGYIEPFRFGAFKPYAGGGVGLAVVQSRNASLHFRGAFADLSLPDQTETNFAWQLGAGVAYELNERVTLDLGYRHLDAGQITVGSNTTASGGVAEHSKGSLVTDAVLLGARYTF